MNEKYTNKYYVGSDKVFNSKTYGPYPGSWAKDSMAEAIAHARKILTNEPERDEVFIVKIVAVVRKPDIPIIVEDV